MKNFSMLFWILSIIIVSYRPKNKSVCQLDLKEDI